MVLFPLVFRRDVQLTPTQLLLSVTVRDDTGVRENVTVTNPSIWRNFFIKLTMWPGQAEWITWCRPWYKMSFFDITCYAVYRSIQCCWSKREQNKKWNKRYSIFIKLYSYQWILKSVLQEVSILHQTVNLYHGLGFYNFILSWYWFDVT